MKRLLMEEYLKEKLLSLARGALENELYGSGHDLKVYDSPEFKVKRGVFVTLTKNNDLRGCIGRIEPNTSIYRNVSDLSLAAAFEDHRFSKLKAADLDKIQIEISILSQPEEVEGATSYEKVSKIRPKKDGVVLCADGRNATFLPQVWDSLPIREDFIGDLCRKAGLSRDYWEKNEVKISVYQVDHFEES
ncbi:MAG: AmmeMemoRadiSam system protein A [Proteobacteria bacterium]|nr:AmmeMemoRadiSam system protein A [Pseudomonadota bacterium]